MKLIFIYGPPKINREMVMKELSKITKFKLFHNHLTVDLGVSIFSFGTKEYINLVDKMRIHLFEAAAKSRIKGMIFTFVYGVETGAKNTDYEFIKNVVRIVKKKNGKVRHIKSFKSIRVKHDLDATIPVAKHLIIDNTKLSARQVSRKIKEYYKV